MEQYISKSALVAELEDWRDKIKKGIFSIPLSGSDRAYATFEYEVLGKVIISLDALEVKEVDEEYNGKAMLHVLEKGVEQGRRELIDKACKWLKKWDAYRVCLEGHKDWFIEQFRKAMKE